MIPKTPPEVLEIQNEIYRKMSPTQKWRVSIDLCEFGLDLLKRGIEQSHPEWNRDEVMKEFRRRLLPPDLFQALEKHRGSRSVAVVSES